MTTYNIVDLTELNTIAGSELVVVLDGSNPKKLVMSTLAAFLKSYTDTKIAALVGNASTPLDTLKEIGDAIGNDPSFAGTIATQMTAKADKTAVAASVAAITADVASLKNSVGVATLNTITATAYTPVLADVTKFNRVVNTSAVTITIPTNASVAFAVGSILTIAASGTGQVNIVGASGVTINVAAGYVASSSAQHTVLQLIKDDTNSWTLYGAVKTA